MGINNPSAGASQWTLLHDETLVAAGRFDVSSISANHALLQFYLQARSDVAADGDAFYVFLNNDTTLANYRYQQLQSNIGATLSSGGDTPGAPSVPAATATANYFGTAWGTIFNYATTDIFKQADIYSGHRRDATATFIRIIMQHFESAAAVDQITIQPDGYPGDEFVPKSRLQIWGIGDA